MDHDEVRFEVLHRVIAFGLSQLCVEEAASRAPTAMDCIRWHADAHVADCGAQFQEER